jgi:hypothetical protein
MTIYDAAGVITAAEAKDMQTVAQDIVEQLYAWLVQTHPKLVEAAK